MNKVDRKLALAMVSAGKSQREVAEYFGVTPEAISYHVRRGPLSGNTAVSKLSKRKIAELASLGFAYAEIGRVAGISRQRVHAIMKAIKLGGSDE